MIARHVEKRADVAQHGDFIRVIEHIEFDFRPSAVFDLHGVAVDRELAGGRFVAVDGATQYALAPYVFRLAFRKGVDACLRDDFPVAVFRHFEYHREDRILVHVAALIQFDELRHIINLPIVQDRKSTV